MAILAILDDIKNRQTSEVEGERTYTYKGPLLPVLKLMGLSSGSANYKRVVKALKMMTIAGVELVIFKRSGRGARKVKKTIMSSMLAVAKWDEDKKELTVTVNPYFYECYIAGFVTLMDVIKRTKLKSPTAKSLYRFMQSHRDNIWQGHFMTLSTALNLDLNLPAFKLRERIKIVIRELIKKKILSPESGLISKDKNIVKLVRCQDENIRRKPNTLPK